MNYEHLSLRSKFRYNGSRFNIEGNETHDIVQWLIEIPRKKILLIEFVLNYGELLYALKCRG